MIKLILRACILLLVIKHAVDIVQSKSQPTEPAVVQARMKSWNACVQKASQEYMPDLVNEHVTVYVAFSM